VTIKAFQTGEQIRTQKERFFFNLKAVNLMEQIHKLFLIVPATTGFQEEYYTWTEYNCMNSIVLPGKAT